MNEAMTMENLSAVFDIVMTLLSIFGGAGVIAASPVAKVLKYAPAVKKVVDVVAMNVGHAKNKD